ncbi:YibE/F family protein [Treponema putidum]|uniref:YibE/F family protein n=1 Tax=Treponema putidum TaxID=221027 RepID=A0ABY5HUS4_9SPIR|nr:YibE/F family protein [Treponema putidum]UTY29172.1 YibE/F family protein [Treponema putidum]
MKRIFLFIVSLLFFNLYAEDTGQISSENLSQDMEKKYDGLSSYYSSYMNAPKSQVVKAKVIEIVFDDTRENRPDIPIESDFRYQHLKIKILTGKHRGEVYTIRNTIELAIPYRLIFKINEKLILQLDEDETGKVNNLRIYERARDYKVYALIFIFAAVLIFVGKKNGLKALISLGLTVGLIFGIFLPLILKGYNPIFWAIIICSLASVMTLFIISGRNNKTYTAILGTIGGVIIAGLFAFVAGKILRLSGLGNEDAQMLAFVPQYRKIDYQGLLFAGIMIGSLGAVMDVAMSISSSMWEIVSVSPKIPNKQLIKSGMNIGRDIIGSMSNTLILAYVSTSIPVLLLFIIFSHGFTEIINLEILSAEILRAVSGSIGLICTIPITVNLVNIFRKN